MCVCIATLLREVEVEREREREREVKKHWSYCFQSEKERWNQTISIVCFDSPPQLKCQ